MSASDKAQSDALECAIRRKDWPEAERIARTEVASTPKSHWAWTVLAAALNEQGRHPEALGASDVAVSIDPDCPLVIWDRGCILRDRGEYAEALRAFRSLVDRGLAELRLDPCAESDGWVTDLYNDSLFESAKAALRTGENHLAATLTVQLFEIARSGSRFGIPVEKLVTLGQRVILSFVDDQNDAINPM